MASQRAEFTRSSGLKGFPSVPLRGGLHKTRRYDGGQKTSRSWDCLRRDAELWYNVGDCLVHLYGPGMSKRGPSFRIPFRAVEESRSSYLLGECLQKPEPQSATSGHGDDGSNDDSSDSGYGASVCSEPSSARIELYIRAPADLQRQEAFQYHIGTRNFFAYLLGKPLVGESLGKALTELAKRIELWQKDGAASTDFLDYCQEQGYLDFSENPDYAAAALYLADKALIKDIWVDAFAHCVGMRDDVENSPEAEGLSNRTKALISRAALEMELHIARVTRAVGVFLEEELGAEYLGLSKPLRNHLDRFRSCLHTHYVSQFGYFPPDESAAWNKKLWFTIFDDFRNLYEYLADSESSDDRSSIRGVNGGVCVIQNIHAFDQRHGYLPLPHPLPLLPGTSTQNGLVGDVQKGLRNFRLGRSDSQPLRTAVSSQGALAQAANGSNPSILSNRLVQEYIRFERAKLEERVPVSEARKVRWLLVYGVLQMLISVTRAPAEVQDTDTPSYPLCVLTDGGPHWMDPIMTSTHDIHQAAVELEGRLSTEMDNVRRTMETDRISIHPDCEADNAEDYFTMNNNTGGLARSASDVSVGMVPHPLRTGSYLARTASFRSGVNSLSRSVVGSLSRRNSTKRASLAHAPAPFRESSFCEIVVEGYGNGLEDSEDHLRDKKPIERARTPLVEFEDTWPNCIPGLEMHQLHLPDTYDDEQEDSPSDTNASRLSAAWSEIFDGPGSSSPISEHSTSSDPDIKNIFSSFDFDLRQPTPPETYQVSTSTLKTGGTYIPTGAVPTRTTSTNWQRRTLSSSSSCYGGEEGTQAAEIEEEEVRGRRRVRGMDRVRGFGMVSGEVSLPVSPV